MALAAGTRSVEDCSNKYTADFWERKNMAGFSSFQLLSKCVIVKKTKQHKTHAFIKNKGTLGDPCFSLLNNFLYAACRQ